MRNCCSTHNRNWSHFYSSLINSFRKCQGSISKVPFRLKRWSIIYKKCYQSFAKTNYTFLLCSFCIPKLAQHKVITALSIVIKCYALHTTTFLNDDSVWCKRKKNKNLTLKLLWFITFLLHNFQSYLLSFSMNDTTQLPTWIHLKIFRKKK